MAVFKCKMCGGTIEFNQGDTVGICDSCGTKQTLPTANDEVITNLHNRANTLRLRCEFDKAEDIYNKILINNPNDAEAHWGIILCKYGIEYVEDPKTYKRVPTCHRTSFDAILADEDYKATMENGDGAQRELYEAEAKEIDHIQKDILSIVKNEKPFDVFICYKETDENGKRTQDSVIANDIYYQLTQDGFKVFYSAITLEDKLGQEYEPYIFAALNSAKVMLVVGSKPEYFTAVWVKNEWSRFLKLMKTDRSKLLIPCYKDIDVYELPEEFTHLQAQDMSKIGFINDLVRGIKKVVADSASEAATLETVVVNGVNTNVAPLLKRAFMFLEDGDWQGADEYCEKVLDQNPENAMAYLGKLMVELQARNRKQLADCAEPFDDRNNYSKILRFGDEALEKEMRGYITHINERNEHARLVGIYNNAKNALNVANTESAFKAAADKFATIRGFEDADFLAEKCLDKAEICRKDAIYASAKTSMTEEKIAAYEAAIKTFQTISGWKDADEQIYACQKKIEEIKVKEEADRLEAERKAEECRIKAEKAAKKRKKAFAIGTPIVAACIAFVIVLTTVIIPNSKYNAVVSLLNNGKIVEAYDSLIALNGYKDSATKASKIFAQYKIEKLKIAEVGDIVYFGSYEWDNNTSNGKEDIEWLVLAKENGKVLVISKQALDCQKYNSIYTAVTWENCSLRTWMNGTFLNNAFSADEQAKIATMNVSADKNLEYSTNPGNATKDKIFLLSITEVEKYFTTDESRKCLPTAYAKAQGAYTSDSYKTASGEATCWWWLRSPGSDHYLAAYVYYDGSVNYIGCSVRNAIGAVRPALWIDLDS